MLSFIKNKGIKNSDKLVEYLVDEYLSRSELDKACKIFSNITYSGENNYLSKFHIYCLINDNKIIREKWLLEFAKDIKELQKLKKNINNSVNIISDFILEQAS